MFAALPTHAVGMLVEAAGKRNVSRPPSLAADVATPQFAGAGHARCRHSSGLRAGDTPGAQDSSRSDALSLVTRRVQRLGMHRQCLGHGPGYWERSRVRDMGGRWGL